eukprot:GHVO01003881.1.p1 GENE.GHVO01003881.1~~GHVO01003881.1.p1  ORF type:complete len:182 (+),score=17.13 GHVO01003881.1:39-584(+)
MLQVWFLAVSLFSSIEAHSLGNSPGRFEFFSKTERKLGNLGEVYEPESSMHIPAELADWSQDIPCAVKDKRTRSLFGMKLAEASNAMPPIPDVATAQYSSRIYSSQLTNLANSESDPLGDTERDLGKIGFGLKEGDSVSSSGDSAEKMAPEKVKPSKKDEQWDVSVDKGNSIEEKVSFQTS